MKVITVGAKRRMSSLVGGQPAAIGLAPSTLWAAAPCALQDAGGVSHGGQAPDSQIREDGVN